MSISTIILRGRNLHKVKNVQISTIPFPVPVLDEDGVPTNGFKDLANLYGNDEGQCLIAAVNQLSIDNPRTMAAEIDITDGENNWSFSLTDLISGWDASTHKVLKVQYHLTRQGEEYFFDEGDWRETIDKNGNPVLRFVGTNNLQGGLMPSENFAVWYTCPHVFDLATNRSTIPAKLEEAVSNHMAAGVLRIAASVASQFSDKQTFDDKDLGQLADRLNKQADIFQKVYEKMVEQDPILSPTFIDIDTGSMSPYGDLLVYPDRSH